LWVFDLRRRGVCLALDCRDQDVPKRWGDGKGVVGGPGRSHR
jgi:hypothetical protein